MKYGLKVITDAEADDLLETWTQDLMAWAKRNGYPFPLPTELVQDLTILATAWSSAFVAGHLARQIEADGKAPRKGEH